MQAHSPLTARHLDDPIAYIGTKLTSLGIAPGTVSVADFVSHVNQLASRLPDNSHALNLCENRYLFLLGFCAAIARGQTNLLPPNKTLATQQTIQERYASTYVLHDGEAIAEGIPDFDITNITFDSQQRLSSSGVPSIPLDFLAAITFTSGSTGESQPNLKYWNTFVCSSNINAKYMLPSEDLVWLAATVPGQHMWGMETSVLLPLMKRVCVSDGRPLFPKDVDKAIKDLSGSPKILVTTPVHLRALVMSGLVFSKVEQILCATAPLDLSLAKEAEQCFESKLQEIYGCSEVGSMAYRRTARDEDWSVFDGISLSPTEGKTLVSAAHLPADIVLQDELKWSDKHHFRIAGRSGDLIEIAGKRGSIAEINKLLMSTEGVLDGAVFQPKNVPGVARLAAFVVMSEGTSVDNIIASFRKKLDPVFIPRPIYQVSQLPREDNGKLTSARLEALYLSLKNTN